MDSVLILVGIGEVFILGIGGALVRYLVKIESRLTKIETKMGC